MLTAALAAPSAWATRPAKPAADGGTGAQWVVRDMPKTGNGPKTDWKHARLAVHPGNGRVYFCGGDYTGPREFMQSGQQGLFSYDVSGDQWHEEYPYCARPGEVNPYHPDQVGWVWDTKRELFWMLPGVQYGSSTCDGQKGRVMTFDPRSRKWAIPKQSRLPGGSGKRKFAQYDADTDTMIMLENDVDCLFRPETGEWDIKKFGGNRAMSGNYTALVNRRIFCLDNKGKQVSAYHIDRRGMSDVAKLPFDPGAMEQTNFVHDSKRNLLIFAKFASWGWHPAQLWLFDIASKDWQKVPVDIPGVERPKGNAMVYHEPTGATLICGGVGPANPHLYLFTPTI